MNTRVGKRAWVGFSALLLAGIAKAGCGSSEAEDLFGASGQGGAGKGGKSGASGKAGAAAGAGGAAAAAPGGLGGAVAGTGGCPEIVPTGVDGFVPVDPCPKNYDCGPGCAPVFSVSYEIVNLSLFRVDPDGVVDTARRALLYRGAATDTKQLGLVEGQGGFMHPAVSPSYIVARHYAYPEPKEAAKQNAMHVYDRTTGKLVHSWSLPGYEGGPSPVFFGAAATDKYVLLSNGASLLRFDIAGGKPKVLADSNCSFARIVNGKYTCADESTYMFTQTDVETGEVTQLAPGPSLQADGSCALDGSACAWVDYRDPPATKSTLSNRLGGEVYRYDFASKQLERLTFDSPDTPFLKYGPMVEGDWIVWQHNTTPSKVAGGITPASFDRLHRQERGAGIRCWYPLTDTLAGSLHGHRLYALHFERGTGRRRVVAIDLDSPDIPWECGPAPAPVVVQ